MSTTKIATNFSRKEKRPEKMIKSYSIKLFTAFFLVLAMAGNCQLSPASQRIVSLVPSHTELMFAMGIGELVVGVTDYCNFPAETAALTKIGNQELNIEKIMALKPSILLDVNGMHRKYELLFSQLGLNYVNFNLKKLSQLPVIALEIAEIVGRKEAGVTFSENWNRQLSELETSSNNANVKAYFEIWDTPMQAAGPESFIGEILSRAGFENILKSTQEYPVINHEVIIQANPDYIFLAYPLHDTSSVQNRPGWRNLSAVANKRIYCLDQDLFVRPGPRNLEGLKILHQLLKK